MPRIAWRTPSKAAMRRTRRANSRSLSSCSAAMAADKALTTTRDPVCGMAVDPATTKHHATHAGSAYHFCSAACKVKFVAEPATYLGKTDKPASPSPETDVIYTCPMHPQIRQKGPGHCPICGMTLEPEVATAEGGSSSELKNMT